VNTSLGDVVMKLVARTEGFTAGLATAETKLRAFTGGMSKLGSDLSMRVSLPLAAAGGAALHMSQDFDHAIHKLVGLAGVAPETAEKWRGAIKGMASETGVAADQLAEAMFYVASGGLRGAEALEVLEAAAKGSRAGMGAVAPIAQAATFAMNAYGKANLSASEAVGIMAAVVREGNVAPEMIAESFGRVLPLAAQMGIKFNELGGAVAAMTRKGLDANLAVTAIRAILSSMLVPSKQASEALRQAGSSFEQIRAAIRDRGMIGALMEVKKAFEANQDAVALVFPEIRALAGVLNLVGADASVTNEIMGKLAKAGMGDLNYAFDQVSKGSGQAMKQMLADLKNMAISVGDIISTKMRPVFLDTAARIRDVSDALDTLSPKAKSWAVDIGRGLILLGVALKVGAVAFGFLAKAVLGVTGAVVGLTGAWGKLAILANVPLTGGAGALTGLAAAAGVSTGAVLALVAAAGAAGVAFGTWLNNVTGLKEYFATAGTPMLEHAKALSEDELAYQTTANQVQRLVKQLQLSGDEWKVSTERSLGNAIQLAQVREALSKLIHARVQDATAAQAQAVATDMDVLAKKRAAEATRALNEAADSLNRTYQVFTAEQLLKAMAAIEEDFAKMAAVGIPAAQATGALKDKVKELGEVAKTFGPSFIKPRLFEDLTDAIGADTGTGTYGAVEALASLVKGRLAREAAEGFSSTVDAAGTLVVSINAVTAAASDLADKNAVALKALEDQYSGLATAVGSAFEGAASKPAALGNAIKIMGTEAGVTFSGMKASLDSLGEGAGDGMVRGFGKALKTVDSGLDEVKVKITQVGKETPTIVFKSDLDLTGLRDKCKKHGLSLGMGVY
jgi:TP901 family phage tail tape measure protein